MGRPSRKTVKKKIDDVVRPWCRSLGYCEAIGWGHECSSQLQWCHIKSRAYLSVRWSKNNCFCLCASHHRWFHANPDDFKTFIDEKFPEKYERLLEEFRPINPLKVWQMEEILEAKKEEFKEPRS